MRGDVGVDGGEGAWGMMSVSARMTVGLNLIQFSLDE